MLNRLINRAPDAPIPDPQPVQPEQVDLQQRTLLDQAVAQHPAIQRVREQLQGFREQLRLAQLNRVPDLNVSVNYNAVADEGLAMSATVTINGGLDWASICQSGPRNMTQPSVKLGVAFWNHSRNSMTSNNASPSKCSRLGWMYSASSDKCSCFASKSCHRRDKALEARRASYRGGQGTFLDVLDAWRRKLELELMHQQNMADLGAALADLRQAVGGQWPSNSNPVPPANDDAAATHRLNASSHTQYTTPHSNRSQSHD